MPTKTEMRKAEALLIDALSQQHGYLIADTLTSAERSTITATRVDGKLVMGSGIGVKLVVPHDSALGREIAKLRKAKTKGATAPRSTRARAERLVPSQTRVSSPLAPAYDRGQVFVFEGDA